MRGARARVGPKLGRLTREKGRGEGREWAAAAGRKRERGEIEPKWLFLFSFSLFYFPYHICIYLNDFEFKFECMGLQKCTTISSTSQANIHAQSFTHQVLFPTLIYFVNIIYIGYMF